MLPTPTTEYLEVLPAAVAISAGDAIYKTAANTYGQAQCDVALGVVDANLVGIAMNSAAIGQPVQGARGLVTIGTGFTVGMQVNLSATAGKFAPVADIATTNNVVAAGCIMSSTTLFVAPKNYGVLHV